MPFGLQPWHLVVIALVALLIFGPSKLPELGRSIGRSITEFRRGTREMTETFKEELSAENEKRDEDIHLAASTTPGTGPVTSPPAPAPQQTTGGNYCTNCGSPNAANARFCNNCGTQLKA